jgi:hypothetical protein
MVKANGSSTDGGGSSSSSSSSRVAVVVAIVAIIIVFIIRMFRTAITRATSFSEQVPTSHDSYALSAGVRRFEFLP